MGSLLNQERPPVFCPGCSHERIVQALDDAFQRMGLAGRQIVLVSDIGCSGLFDTFFNTHAMHGLHGRALTYATGIKMARPDLHVIVTMGDGGLGIGGAHVLSTCRRNIDLTLLILNNFNYGMTGGQCSATTPENALVGSGFLNRLEMPMDICQVAGSAGAGYVARLSAYQNDLAEKLALAIGFNGFSLVDIQGLCTGRYTKKNKLTPKMIADNIECLPPVSHFEAENNREEYCSHYQQEGARLSPASPPLSIKAEFVLPETDRQEIVILGSAGQRIVTAGEILCLAFISAGLHTTQKNDYPITVLRGHSISELVLAKEGIDYTGIDIPSVVIALAPEGVAKRLEMLAGLEETTWILAIKGLEIPSTSARITELDFHKYKIKSRDWALAALIYLACKKKVLTLEMLRTAVGLKFSGKVVEQTSNLIDQVSEFL